MPDFASRAGLKLDHALTTFKIDVRDYVCADLGSNTGGFVDCLLQRGAARVYAIDTGYGALDWRLRNDGRVIVMERTNAMHAALPEKVDLVTIDVAWTRQAKILPAAKAMIRHGGSIVTLIKPHYEAEPAQLRKGILPVDQIDGVVHQVERVFEQAGLKLVAKTSSPITGGKGNTELLAWLRGIE